MKKVVRMAVLAALMVMAAACGNNKKTEAPSVVKQEMNKVAVDSAITMDVPTVESYTSTVLPYALNNISPMQGVRIEKINFEIGDKVRAGQVLVEAGTLKLEQAELKFKNDGIELERLKGLYEEGGVSQSDYDAAVLAYDLSRKSLEDLRANTIVVSPINGVVTAKNCEVGDVYAMGQPVLVVQQVTPVKLIVGVSESDYSFIKKGDEVSIKVEALPGKEFKGKVNKIYPTVDVATRTVPVEVLVPNHDMQLKPGMYAKVDVTFQVNRSVVVPDKAVVKQPGSAQRVVYKLNPDQTVSIEVVKIGHYIDNKYEILSGVEKGDIVVVRGQSRLKGGEKVQVVK